MDTTYQYQPALEIFGDVSPTEYQPPQEIPGWGQIHANVIDDEVTRGKYALVNGGPAYAMQHHGEGLRRMMQQKTWRSEAAANLYYLIQRFLLEEARVSVPQRELVLQERL
jgi:hypothetical protein